jgi:hypothetical protein
MDGYLGYAEQLNTKTFSNLMKQIDKAIHPDEIADAWNYLILNHEKYKVFELEFAEEHIIQKCLFLGLTIMDK